MEDGFRRFFSINKVQVKAEPNPIHAGKDPAGPRALPSTDRSIRGLFVNDQLNSRLTMPLQGVKAFELLWRAGLAPNFAPIAIAQAGDRVLAISLSGWMLWDMHGKSIRQGIVQYGELVLDAGRGVFFAPDTSGLIAAYRLTTGEPAFFLSLNSNKTFFRSYMARRDRRLVTVSTQLPLDMSQPEPERTIVEVTNLGDPAAQKSYDEEGGPAVAADLVRDTTAAYMAMHKDAVLFATRDRLYAFDLDLTIRRILTGSFNPIAMSVDEMGRTYLIADEAGQVRLSRISVNGERGFSFALPPELRTTYAPIVGYDHRVYLPAGNSLLAVEPDGKLAWRRQTQGHFGGATVASDDVLLCSEGSDVAGYSAGGDRRALAGLPGEQLLTAPVLTGGGTLLVASKTALFHLGPKR